MAVDRDGSAVHELNDNLDQKFQKDEADSFQDYVAIGRKRKVRVVDLANAEVEKAIKMMLAE